jgi:hypothetical protein
MGDKELINKNIEKQCVIIDTDDLTQTSNTRVNAEYNIKFNENGFGGVFNDVIGFRLKSAIIRNNPILINSSNSTITLTDGGSGAATYVLKSSKYGYYEGNSWALLLKTGSSWVGDTAPLTACSFDQTTNKLTFTGDPHFDFTTNKEVARLLGFNLGQTTVNSTVSDFPIDLSNHYIDVVVDEIPFIACKKTASGKKVTERIPLTGGLGAINYFQCDPSNFQSQNYFFPIKLSEINIKLYTDNNNLLSSSNEQNSFEFEITMLKRNNF